MTNRTNLNKSLQLKQSEGFKVCKITEKRVYMVNNHGVVISIGTKLGKVKELAPVLVGGYLYVNIDLKPTLIHRLVAETFLGLNTTNLVVNHKDGNKTNNELSNLEFVTQSVNTIHGHMLGRVNIYDRAIEIIESGYEGFTGKTDFCWNNGLGLSYGTCWNICADVEKYKERIILMEKYNEK